MKTYMAFYTDWMVSLPLLFCFFFLSEEGWSQEYFQQEVNYTISVELDDINHALSAFAEMEYTNNSPDELSFIWFHIWPNAYSSPTTALVRQKGVACNYNNPFVDPEKRGFIDSLDFRVNGTTAQWEYHDEHVDICKVYLPKPLATGEKTVISTPFYVKIPSSEISRLGHHKQSYQITQWYPKPAVYDRFGWHAFPYLNMGEFYSEFGSFDVTITVPDNYYVAATGNLHNEDEVQRIIARAEETAKKGNFDIGNMEFPPSSETKKRLRYTEENIHDFAWFADKRFNILAGEVTLPHSGRKVQTWTFFPDQGAPLWQNAVEYINDALHYYSAWYGDYPYNHCSAVYAPISAGGGMEYPGITVIGNASTAMSLEMVIMHEVGHNWFYGMLGTNEREHPWMDEGITTFSEIRYFTAKYPDNRMYRMFFDNPKTARLFGIEDKRYHHIHRLTYLLTARANSDQPASLHSEAYSGMNYGAMTYSKAGLAFYHCMLATGEEKFNKAMQDYYETWKFKHPCPDDLKTVFEKHIEEDVTWLFNDLIASDKKLDYKVSRLRNGNLLVKNKGQIAAPLLLYGISDDTTIFEKVIPGFRGKQWISLPENTPEKVVIDAHGFTTDLYPKNNSVRTGGWMRRTEPLEFNLLGVLENPDKTSVNILPVAAINRYNGLMAGGLLYSSPIPLPRLEYQVMPMFSFGASDLAGMGKIRYNILPHSNTFRMVTPFIAFRQFGYDRKPGRYYQMIKTGIELEFRSDPLSKTENSLTAEYLVASDFKTARGKLSAPDASLPDNDPDWKFRPFYRIGYDRHINRKTLLYNYHIEFDGSYDFVKSVMEADISYHFFKKNEVRLRVFGGAFLHRDSNEHLPYDISLSGTHGTDDELYDYLFMARFEDPSSRQFLSNQFVPDQGGFGIYTGRASETWLLASNIASSLPIRVNLPVQVYFNAALLPSEDGKTTGFLFESGVMLHLIRRLCTIYFPAFMSDDIRKYSDQITGKYSEKIRFTLRLDQINPFDMVREIW